MNRVPSLPPNPSVRISLVLRLRREEGGRFSQELVVQSQIEVLPSQSGQSSPFVFVQRARGVTVDAASVSLGFDPGAQGPSPFMVDVELGQVSDLICSASVDGSR